ncbi:MAG: type 1 glutamine amidotransferase domain-containing protein [Bryobacteraceae bacterium]|jgi:protease I
MSKALAGYRIAILATDGFEQVEMTEPRKALEEAGAEVDLIALEKNEVQGMNHDEKGNKFPVDAKLGSVSPSQYQALLLPGGVANPDRLRTDAQAVRFVKAFAEAGKPIAAICHGPWMLVEADIVRGRKLTSWPSLKTDIRNAGGAWQDSEVVVDRGLVTSRKPADIPAFNRTLIEVLAEKGHKQADSEAGHIAQQQRSA